MLKPRLIAYRQWSPCGVHMDSCVNTVHRENVSEGLLALGEGISKQLQLSSFLLFPSSPTLAFDSN